MSKRSLEDSRDGQVPDVDHNGSLPIHDLLSPGEDPESTATGTAKKPRNFIATVVGDMNPIAGHQMKRTRMANINRSSYPRHVRPVG